MFMGMAHYLRPVAVPLGLALVLPALPLFIYHSLALLVGGKKEKIL